jgi:ABC-type nitrate/sulfonate/bicarbonate transport system substrate-binding protein
MVKFDGGSCEETEIVPVNNGFFHTKALLEDKADVATLIFANFELPEAKGSNLDVDFFDLKKYGVPDFCQLVLMTSPQSFAKQPHKFLSLNRALRDAVDWIKLNPNEAKLLWLERFPPASEAEKAMMDDILDRTLYMFPHQQDLSELYWHNLESWLLRTGQIETSSEGPIDYWSNTLAFELSESAPGKMEL